LQRAADQDFSSRLAQAKPTQQPPTVPSIIPPAKAAPVPSDYNGQGPPLDLPNLTIPAQQGNLRQNQPATVSAGKQSNNTVNFGDINVHTAATDGPGTGAAVVTAINKNLLVTSANQGLV
jgi:hypothetical protein